MFAFAFIILVVILLMLAQFKGDFNRRIHELQDKIEKLAAENQALERKQENIKSEESDVDTYVLQSDSQAVETYTDNNTPDHSISDNNIAKAKSPLLPFTQFFQENLLIKIAACILIISIALLTTNLNPWNDQSNPYISVGGPLLGGALLYVAYLLYNKRGIISSILTGLGGVALMLTIAYLSDSSYWALDTIMMLAVIIFMVVLAINYNSSVIAVITLVVGIHLLPYVSFTFQSIIPEICIPLMILGMLVLAHYKRWYAINITFYILTIIWWFLVIDPVMNVPAIGQVVISTIFYLVAFADFVVGLLTRRFSFNKWVKAIFLFITAFYYINGIFALHAVNNGVLMGAFTVFLTLLHLVLAWVLYRRNYSDPLQMMISLVLVFLTLTGATQLTQGYIIIYWAVESVLLYWLYLQIKFKVVQHAAILVAILVLLALVAYWVYTYFIEYNILGFITGVIVLGLLALLRYLILKHAPGGWDFGPALVAAILGIAILIAAYFTLQLELHHQIKYRWTLMMPLTDGIFIYACIAALLIAARTLKGPYITIGLAAAGLALLAYPLFLNNAVIIVRNRYLMNGSHLNYVLMHYPLVILYFVLLYLTYKITPARYTQLFQWVCVIAVVYMLSASMDHLAALTGFKHKASIRIIVHHNQGLGYMLLWTFSAMVIMYLGVTWSAKQLKIIALSLFGLMLLKLFFLDLPEMPTAGKITSFVLLGIIVAVIITQYQRLKKFISLQNADTMRSA
jgi:hypothetical protein